MSKLMQNLYQGKSSSTMWATGKFSTNWSELTITQWAKILPIWSPWKYVILLRVVLFRFLPKIPAEMEFYKIDPCSQTVFWSTPETFRQLDEASPLTTKP
jgi:hypothetical protein